MICNQFTALWRKKYYLDKGSRRSDGKNFTSTKQSILIHIKLLGKNRIATKKTSISDKFHKNIVVDI